MAQHTEMVFAFPWSFTDDLLEGLQGTDRGGTRYPVPVAMRSHVAMPKRYRDLPRTLEEDEPGAG